jgi:ribonuclease P protein component
VPSPTVGRITSRAAFAELQRSRARGSSGSVRAVFTPAPAPTPALGDAPTAPDLSPTPSPAASDVFPQVGFAVSRQCGSAVVRNRLRRQARAVVRSEAPQLPRGRYLLRFSPDSASASPVAFRADVAQALRKASREQAVRTR